VDNVEQAQETESEKADADEYCHKDTPLSSTLSEIERLPFDNGFGKPPSPDQQNHSDKSHDHETHTTHSLNLLLIHGHGFGQVFFRLLGPLECLRTKFLGVRATFLTGSTSFPTANLLTFLTSQPHLDPLLRSVASTSGTNSQSATATRQSRAATAGTPE
jgi:hypothetical protein